MVGAIEAFAVTCAAGAVLCAIVGFALFAIFRGRG